MSIAETFTPEFANRMATANSVKRGNTYARNGRIILDLSDDDLVEARAKGTETYRVTLSTKSGTQSWSCNCVAAYGGQFCKHCVAVAIVAADSETPVGDPEVAAIEGYLSSLSANQLVAILIEQTQKDERFADFILASAQLSIGDAPDLVEWKKKVTKAYGRGFIDYRHASAWAAEVNEMLSTIADIGEAGHHQSAALLAEHAHKRTETAQGRVDDSAGWITQIFGEIRRIHIEACLAGAFPPKKLAQRLVKLELAAELDTFHQSAVSHAAALGEEGLAEYSRLVEAAALKLPSDADRWGAKFRVTAARKGHALATNDPDHLIEILTDEINGMGQSGIRDFSSSDYITVMGSLEQVGRIDEALEWADRGLRTNSRWPHILEPIMSAKAELLRGRGELGQIDEMYWSLFELRPDLSSYDTLVSNTSDPDLFSNRAIDKLLGQLGKPEEPEVGRTQQDRSYSNVVTILLRDGRYEEAWEVALRQGAESQDWDRLAKIRQHEHPADAITVLGHEVERHIGEKKRASYGRAVRTLAKIEKLASECDRPDLYVEILLGVQTRHKQKTALMSLLK